MNWKNITIVMINIVVRSVSLVSIQGHKNCLPPQQKPYYTSHDFPHRKIIKKTLGRHNHNTLPMCKSLICFSGNNFFVEIMKYHLIHIYAKKTKSQLWNHNNKATILQQPTHQHHQSHWKTKPLCHNHNN
jgi:hypothetical protein